MKIEEIKVRLSNLDAGKVVKYDVAMNLATQYMIDYRSDVTYLVSIIEQAEKALVAYREFEQKANCHWCGDGVREIVNEVLKVIRGN